MSHIDYNLGVYYPMGGFGSLADAFVKLGKEYGVIYKNNVEVNKIFIKNGVAKEVLTNKGTYSADIIISNVDYHHTETKLIEKNYQSYSKSYWESRTLAPSAYIIHLGIKGKVKNLIHHNLILEHDWQKHFDSIFEKPSWPANPSYYLCCPTKTDPTIAPKGTDILFALVPVASGLKDTDKLRKEYAEKLLADIERHTKDKIKDRIVYKKIYSQRDFIRDYNAYKGTALGLAHTLKQTANFRPSMKSKKIDNLYYVGQYTQPGIGVPIAVISSQLVTDRITMENE